MARRKSVYCKNISDEPQLVRHTKLDQVDVVPVAPGGFTEVVNCQFTLPPGAICRLPISVWELIPGIGKKSWSLEVTKEEFLAALTVPAEPYIPEAESEPEPEPEPRPRRRR